MSGMETLVERACKGDEMTFTQSEQCSNEVPLKRVTQLVESLDWIHACALSIL